MTEDKPDRMPNVPPFVKFVASAVPMVFDNSLSYYEALCALWKYVQGMTDVINNNATLEEEYIIKFNELKSFVDNYFDNLDVQEEINNKLDAMVEDGTLPELINAFLQANVAWVFDTVADMQLATNLIAGSYARTLGFHTANDGGGALYKISDTGVANGMDVIAIDSLYASLMYGNEINVKQLGAYGDNTTDDSAIFTRGATLAASAALPLYIPKDTYKLTSQINLKSLVIRCEGTLNNAQPLILGALSNGSTNTDVEIFKCDDVTVEGAKNSYFNILHCGDLVLTADGSDATISSIGYCKFEGIDVASITLTGANNGWINENEFNIKRNQGNLTITGDGTYPHNNNHFNDICMEGAGKSITINYGFSNYITFRGESFSLANQVVINNDPSKCHGNVIKKQYSTVWSSIISPADLNINDTLNYIGNEYLPTAFTKEIMNVNPNTAKHVNASIFVDGDGKVTGSWAPEYQCSNIPADMPFTITVMSSSSTQRISVFCYDSNGDAMQANVAGVGITRNTSTNEYASSNNAQKISCTYTPTDGVDHVKVIIKTGASMHFDWAIAQVYTPLLNLANFENEFDQTKKYLTAAPTNLTNLGQTWAVGDIVWNSNPTAGGAAAWICTTAGSGSASVWKAISIAS